MNLIEPARLIVHFVLFLKMINGQSFKLCRSCGFATINGHMQLQLQLSYGHGDSEIFDLAAKIVVCDSKIFDVVLKLWLRTFQNLVNGLFDFLSAVCIFELYAMR